MTGCGENVSEKHIPSIASLMFYMYSRIVEVAVGVKENTAKFPSIVKLLLHSLSRITSINNSSNAPVLFCANFVSSSDVLKLFRYSAMLAKLQLSSSSSNSTEFSGSKRSHRRINAEHFPAGLFRHRCIRLICIYEFLQEKERDSEIAPSQVSDSPYCASFVVSSSPSTPLVESIHSFLSELSTTETIISLTELVRSSRMQLCVILDASKGSQDFLRETKFSAACTSPARNLHIRSANPLNAAVIKLSLRVCMAISELLPNVSGSILSIDSTSISSDEALQNLCVLDSLLTEITEVLGKFCAQNFAINLIYFYFDFNFRLCNF